ncbi:MAG: hypothetical protein HN402_04805 [Candidatus Scalindua sp.]|jgi:hypothetical protein|nr:hypothetical protein [Candidatus Scalindua sp.]
MIKDKLLLSKTSKSMLSSSFISIIISMCLLVNLFAPGFSTVVHKRSVALRPESHTCECNPELHSISSCCCAIDINASEEKSLLKEDYQGIFSTFIKSLGCSGLPDQSTSFSYNVSLPEDDCSSPKLSMLFYLKKHQEVFPASLRLSPPDKPPRHHA